MRKVTRKKLTATQVERLKEILEVKAKEIRQSLGGLDRTPSQDNDRTDLDDLPSQSHEEWIFLSRNNIDKMLLQEIEEALLRVEGGTYGVCIECGGVVDPKRLEAIPWASFCISCQEDLAAHAQREWQTPVCSFTD